MKIKCILFLSVLSKLHEELWVYSQKEAQLLKSQSLFLKALKHEEVHGEFTIHDILYFHL